jgi:cell division protein YceG involved in septum cleavage
MADDWPTGDPFADPHDPEAAARDQRRREREERRRMKEEKQRATEAAAPAAPPPPPDPPVPPRTPEQDFWGEEPAPASRPSPARPPRGPRPPRRGSAALSALRRHPLRVAAGIGALLVVWFLFALFQPLHGDGSGRVVIRIPKGASVSEVGDILDEEGVVSSSTLFQVRVTIAGKRSDLYPGRFVLAHDMSYGDAIDALSTPPVKAVAAVTIPEGFSRAQAAPLVSEAGLTGSYMKASRGHEGFLFPDTFELKPHAPAADLVQLQLQDFRRRTKGVDLSYARSKNLTLFDVVTIASMVQAESGVPGQDRLVAAVIYNRLHEGMPLGIDATTRFATGNYDSPLTESELASDSPYNTRTHSGLPPGPIGNPGLAAIEAAAHPAKVGYLYYVTKPGACNELSFAKTEAEFEADVARYNSAREAAGGNSPTTCE